MYVGFMHNFRKPPKLVEVLAMACKHYNIDIVYMRPADVDIERNVIRGKVLVDNKWKIKEVEIPPFIDISPYCFKQKNRTITNYLKERTFLSDNRENVLTKERLQDKLKEDPKFSHLVIPTEVIKNLNDIKNYLEQYPKIILKPLRGIKGKGVYMLSKEEDHYKISYNKDEWSLDDDGLQNFYRETIALRKYIMQKSINSRSLQGDPFDCRLHVQKDGEGKWVSASNYIRVGIGQKVVSNISQGGGIAEPKEFLKANYGDLGVKLNKQLNEVAKTLPYKIEELRGTHIMSLGIDIGIDSDGKLYLFEVNDGPGTSRIIGEVAILRSGYYKYVLEEIISEPKLATSQNIFNPSKELSLYQKEVELYKKEIDLLKKEIELLKKEKTITERVY